MPRVVLSFVSRHTGHYLVIGGRTKEGAQTSAKVANRILRERFPGSTLSTPRYLGFDPKTTLERFEVGVLGEAAGCQSFLKEMVVKGTLS